MWASSQGRYECVEALLAAGSNVNAVDADGLSALMWASGSEAAGDEVHRKAFFEKAMKGHVQVVNLLLKYGAEVDRRDNDLITALMFASFNGHDGAVQALLNAGANADFINRSGKTALMLAKTSGNQNVVEVIENGPSIVVSYQDLSIGMSSLHSNLPSLCNHLLARMHLLKNWRIFLFVGGFFLS